MPGTTDLSGPESGEPAHAMERRLGPAEVMMRKLAVDPHKRSLGLVIWILDRTPDWGDFVETWDRASRAMPRMRQRLVDAQGGAYWVNDPNFDLRYHVRRVRVPEPGGMRELFDLAAPIHMAPTDPVRGSWEIILVEGLADGRAALIQRGDHTMVDGQGGMQMMEVICDLERTPARRPMPDLPPPDDLSEIVRADLTHRLLDAPRSGVHAVRRAAGLAASAVLSPTKTYTDTTEIAASLRRNLTAMRAPKSTLTSKRSLSLHFEAIEVSLDDLKRAGKSTGGSLNDAFLGAVTGGVLRYHQHHGVPIEVIPVGASISIRKPGDSMMANKIGGTIVVIPADPDPVVRMASAGEQVRTAREDPLLSAADAMTAVMAVVPVGLLSSAISGPDVNTSNLPGPPIPLYIAGAKVERMFGFAPLTGTAMMLGLLSVEKVCCIGIDLDPAAVPDADVFLDCLQESFQEVLDLGGENGGVTLPTRAAQVIESPDEATDPPAADDEN